MRQLRQPRVSSRRESQHRRVWGHKLEEVRECTAGDGPDEIQRVKCGDFQSIMKDRTVRIAWRRSCVVGGTISSGSDYTDRMRDEQTLGSRTPLASTEALVSPAVMGGQYSSSLTGSSRANTRSTAVSPSYSHIARMRHCVRPMTPNRPDPELLPRPRSVTNP